VDYVNSKGVGEFLKAKIFGPGRLLRWDDLIEKATGEKLSAKAFAIDFKEN
jgi:peptidyl-dipeptidase A